jgi:plastocyanin
VTKKIYILFAACILGTLLLGACNSTSTASSTSKNQVQMDNTTFAQTSITIKKGESITLTSSTIVAHTISNGTWKNGTPEQAKESGAPAVNGVLITGNSSQDIGPFTSAGTFQLYCTVHADMNLTVIVQ